MAVQRINGYTDSRFPLEILRQHGAFLVNGEPWTFQIVSDCTAIVNAPAISAEVLKEAAEEFRYYSGHITEFFDKAGNCLLRLPPVQRWEVEIDSLQPSQFSVDQEKCAAVGTFIHTASDVTVPVVRLPDGYLCVLDGHTRLYTAWQKGIRTAIVYACPQDEVDLEETAGFVQEARQRKIFHIRDMAAYTPAEQAEKWIGWCEAYFAAKQQAASEAETKDPVKEISPE